jgi:protoporphyrinogen IX oxidase
MAWLKALHIATLLVWCAGLFYLPGLFAAHPLARNLRDLRRIRSMTRFTYVAVTSPAAVLAILSGTALVYVAEARGGWLVLKLTAVSLMVLYHLYCGRTLARLHTAPAALPPAAHLALLVVPGLLVPIVLWLVLGKPM